MATLPNRLRSVYRAACLPRHLQERHFRSQVQMLSKYNHVCHLSGSDSSFTKTYGAGSFAVLEIFELLYKKIEFKWKKAD